MTEYTFFSVAHGIFSKIEHILGYKANLANKKIEIIPRILSNHNGIKLEINDKIQVCNFFLVFSLYQEIECFTYMLIFCLCSIDDSVSS